LWLEKSQIFLFVRQIKTQPATETLLALEKSSLKKRKQEGSKNFLKKVILCPGLKKENCTGSLCSPLWRF